MARFIGYIIHYALIVWASSDAWSHGAMSCFWTLTVLSLVSIGMALGRMSQV